MARATRKGVPPRRRRCAPATPRRSSARYAQIAWLKAWQGLQFVRRGVDCAVRYRDWRRGIAALLGRFLPRLGPHLGAAPFFVARVTGSQTPAACRAPATAIKGVCASGRAGLADKIGGSGETACASAWL